MEQMSLFDTTKKPLPGFSEAAERMIAAGYRAGWINKNVDTMDKYVFFIGQKNNFGYRSDCPHYEGIWLAGSFSSVKCAVCATPVPVLHLELTCGKDYMQCPFYNGESIENYDISEELL